MISHDLEDIIAVVDGRASLVTELESAPPEVRAFVTAAWQGLWDGYCASPARGSPWPRRSKPSTRGRRFVANRGHVPHRSSVIKYFVWTPSEVDLINVQTMHETGQRIESLHMRARGVMMQKNRGSRISNQPGRKRLGVKWSQVQVLSPRHFWARLRPAAFICPNSRVSMVFGSR